MTTEPVARASSSLGEVDPHRMIPAYLRVVIIEILVLLGLWSFSWYFGS